MGILVSSGSRCLRGHEITLRLVLDWLWRTIRGTHSASGGSRLRGRFSAVEAAQQGWLVPGKGTLPAELLFGAEVLQEAAGWTLIVLISQPLVPRRRTNPRLPAAAASSSRGLNALNTLVSGAPARSRAGERCVCSRSAARGGGAGRSGVHWRRERWHCGARGPCRVPGVQTSGCAARGRF